MVLRKTPFKKFIILIISSYNKNQNRHEFLTMYIPYPPYPNTLTMASPNNTDQVIIDTKEGIIPQDKMLIKISEMTDKQFREQDVFGAIKTTIKENYPSCVQNYAIQQNNINNDLAEIEEWQDIIDDPLYEEHCPADVKKVLTDNIKKAKELIKFHKLQQKKSCLAVRIGNAVMNKKRQMATTYLAEYKNVLNCILEASEMMVNDDTGTRLNVINDEGTLNEQHENEGMYLKMGERCKADFECHNFNVKFLINEYYRLN